MKDLKFIFFLVLCNFFSHFSYGQLSNFTLQVIPTNETCTGNGTLSFVISGETSGSSIDYTVYLLPNTSSPFAILSTSLLSGLNAGNYRVVATQTLNGNSGTQQSDVVINNSTLPLVFTLVGTKTRCGNDGKITVNVGSGNPTVYEIISGPMLVPPQGSNVFLNLAPGIYQIKVLDNCGEAVVQTFTLLQTPISLAIDPVVFPTDALPSCDTILVSNYFGVITGNVIAYPLTFEYTIFPPSGGLPIIQTRIINAGNLIDEVIPFYENQSYYYNLKATDACGTVYNRNNNIVNKKFDFTPTILRLNCNDVALKLAPNYFVAPCTVNFLSAPSGFVPFAFNANHPGPFTGSFIVYGANSNSFPLGNYSMQITDGCGRSIIKNVTVVPVNPIPIAVGSNNGCGHVSITISGVQLASVVIVSAPSSYAFSLPNDLSNLINTTTNQFDVFGLPEGNYSFEVTDSCGLVNAITASVLPYSPIVLSIINRPGCEEGYGSVRLKSAEGIVSVSLVNAPSTFSGSFPIDLSANIVGDEFYFDGAPEGDYTFIIQNTCGAQRTETISIVGYQVSSNTVNLTENCGSFNLFLQHVSNGSFQQTFWLQKLNLVNNTWGHPGTNVGYVNGTFPNPFNSVLLNTNSNNLNLAYSGQFRILKTFTTYSSQGELVMCNKEIKTFEVFERPKITNVYSFGCSNGSNEVIIEAAGNSSLSYSITSMNGSPFFVNNGGQNVFLNLLPGVYNFQVVDSCGNIVNSLYDITAISPMAIQASSFCENQNAFLSVPSFSFLNYEWWKDNNTTILSTTNSLLFLPFNQTTDPGLYHVRIFNPTSSSSCIDLVLDYQILPNLSNPNAGQGSVVSYCGNQGMIDLFDLLSGSYDDFGNWSEITNSGTLINNLWDSSFVSPGTYLFKYSVNGSCDAFDETEVVVTIKSIPIAPIVSIEEVVCDTQILSLNTLGVQNATYFWTGPNGFLSSEQNPVINAVSVLNNGMYYLKVVIDGCESEVTSIEVSVNQVPQFIFESYCHENSFFLSAVPVLNSYDANGANYNWSGPDGFISYENPIDITGKSGIYDLVVTNSHGCSTTNSIEIANAGCVIPLGISPNGDGFNQNFDLSDFDVQKLKIFSRYGRMVFEQNNYTNQWHGQDFNNRELPDGTYYYYIQLKSGKEKTGWVYVTR